jgi:hypothetical protein
MLELALNSEVSPFVSAIVAAAQRQAVFRGVLGCCECLNEYMARSRAADLGSFD